MEAKKDDEIEKLAEENKSYNLTQASKIIGVTRRTLYNYLERGLIEGFYKNGMPRILKSEIKRYLEEQD
jgi:predicted site-specific integrase-resolvase